MAPIHSLDPTNDWDLSPIQKVQALIEFQTQTTVPSLTPHIDSSMEKQSHIASHVEAINVHMQNTGDTGSAGSQYKTRHHKY